MRGEGSVRKGHPSGECIESHEPAHAVSLLAQPGGKGWPANSDFALVSEEPFEIELTTWSLNSTKSERSFFAATNAGRQ
jgi:hypothetical protein